MPPCVGKLPLSPTVSICTQKCTQIPFWEILANHRGCIEVIKGSMPSGVYSALDSFHLAAFAMAWVIHKRAAHEIGNRDFAFTVPGFDRVAGALALDQDPKPAGGDPRQSRRPAGPGSEKPGGAEAAQRKAAEKQVRWSYRASGGITAFEQLTAAERPRAVDLK